MNEVTIKAQYESLTTEREEYERVAEMSAEMTIPSLFVRNDNQVENMRNKRVLVQPNQSVGAIGINNLATNLLLAVFPSGAPFFRTVLDELKLRELENEAGQDFAAVKSELEQSLRKVEAKGLELLEQAKVRATLFEILRQYLLAQVLIYQDPKTLQMKGYKLSQHVNVRDMMGNVIKYITMEVIDPMTLSEEHQEEASISMQDLSGSDLQAARKKRLYTLIERTSKNKWETVQAVEDVTLESTRQKWTEDTLPWYDIAHSRIIGEPYGRGYVEQLLGDLRSSNGLRKSIVEGSLISGRTIFAVDPASSTTPEQLVKVPNGGFVRGRDGDITPIQVNKQGDYSTAQTAEMTINKTLELAFMSKLAARRDAERVTAEEFAEVAGEIDQTLGGTFSRLSVELQMPMAKLTLNAMQKQGYTKNLKEAGVRTTIVTGIAALGRGTDLNRLRAFLGDLQGLQAIVGPEQVAPLINATEGALRLANGNGVNASNLLRSESDIQAEREAAQQQQQQLQNQQMTADLAKTAMAHPEGIEPVQQAMEGMAASAAELEQNQ